MDLKQAKLILEKINRLYETMTLDSKVDEFEQDLMLAYVKQLYDSFSDNPDTTPQPIKRRKPPVISKKKEPKINYIIEEEEEETPPSAGRPEMEIPKESTEIPPEPVEEEEVELELQEAFHAPKQVKPSTPSKPTPVYPSMDKKVAAIFEFESGSEISDKLGLQPINDLTKAFGINEKILTINELFGKDQTFYEGIMERLNRLANFDEAKYVLAQIAEKNGWAEADKKKKAVVFVKKVYRRYL